MAPLTAWPRLASGPDREAIEVPGWSIPRITSHQTQPGSGERRLSGAREGNSAGAALASASTVRQPPAKKLMLGRVPNSSTESQLLSPHGRARTLAYLWGVEPSTDGLGLGEVGPGREARIRGAWKQALTLAGDGGRGKRGWLGSAVVISDQVEGHGSTGFGSSADEEVAARVSGAWGIPSSRPRWG